MPPLSHKAIEGYRLHLFASDQRMELYLSSTHCLFSCVQTRRSGMSQRWYRSPNMPVGRNFTATAVVCLQTLICFVRFYLLFLSYTLCAQRFSNAYTTRFLGVRFATGQADSCPHCDDKSGLPKYSLWFS